MFKRKIYLETIPVGEALEKWQKTLESKGILQLREGESVFVENSLGRITAEPISAKISSPHYQAAAMDGMAVRFRDTFGASETTPKRLKIGVEALFVDTGDPLPQGFDAVIMIEDIHTIGEEVEVIAPVTPWQHVRTIGEDIISTEMVVPANHQIRPLDIGAILASGVTEILVRRKPKVGIIPTGTELVEPGDRLKPGDIIEYNSRVLGALIRECGGEFIKHSPVPDIYEEIETAILETIPEVDLLLVIAGSSAGSKDFTATIVNKLGELLVHGVRTRPGKPVVLGLIQEKPVVGIPGYPVSAFLAFDLFVKPLLFKMLGVISPSREKVKAVISKKVASAIGAEEFLRVKLGKVGERVIATPLPRGAGLISSLVKADGLVRIPALSEGVEAGEEVEVEIFRSREEIENTIVMIGSHDLTLDLLANELKKKYPELTLSSAHVGSMGGLLALKRKEAHLAGSHLLDEETGEYNVPFIKRILPDVEIVLVNLVYRDQGLILPPGNPKGINDLRDLVRSNVVFVNRQRGAGTRVLLDYKLKKLRLNPRDIRGYEREEYTHMAVAATVATGVADVGLGIRAAAKALGLEFIPVAKERYDLIIPRIYFHTLPLQKLLEVIRSAKFKEKVEALGGYDISQTGNYINI